MLVLYVVIMYRAPRTGGPEDCQNQLQAPLILQGCSMSDMSQIIFVCV